MRSTDPFIATLQTWIEVFMRRSMHNFIHFSKERGLSMSQIGALFRICRVTSGVSDLGDNLGITKAAASQMLERLVQQELILRTEDPHDRRSKQIVLSEKGCRTLQESMDARQDWLNDLAITLSTSEKEQIISALNILIEKAKQIETHAEQ
jgi:DNA-binding MarR family transcriptional regulator